MITGVLLPVPIDGYQCRVLIHGLLSLLDWCKEGFGTPNRFILDWFNTVRIFVVCFQHAFGNGMPCDGCTRDSDSTSPARSDFSILVLVLGLGSDLQAGEPIHVTETICFNKEGDGR